MSSLTAPDNRGRMRFHPRKRPALLSLVLVVVIVVLAWQERASILRGAARIWIVSDTLDHADAIVVLGGDLETRPALGAELYRRAVSPRVLVSNTMPEIGSPTIPDHTELNRRILIHLGVPAEAISEFGENVTNTYQEARALLQWARDNGATTFIIPMDIFPTRRVKWIFERELDPAGIHVAVQAAKPRQYGADDWWRNEAGLITFQNEVVKYAYYRYKY